MKPPVLTTAMLLDKYAESCAVIVMASRVKSLISLVEQSVMARYNGGLEGCSTIGLDSIPILQESITQLTEMLTKNGLHVIKKQG
jgi:hypothetical protein